jgi:hypothetical protein
MDKRIKYIGSFATLGALLSRWHGGGFHQSPKVIKNIAFALFPTIVLALIIPNDNTWTYSGWLVFCFAVTLAMKATGHGGNFDLGHSPKEPNAGRDLEALEGLIYPYAYEWLPRYFYDALGMGMKGLFMSLGMAIPLLVYAPVLAVPVIIGGLLLAVSYMIGWAFFPDKYATEVGEYLGGFFFYMGASLAWWFA